MFVNRKELAELLGVHTNSITNFIERGMPHSAYKRYNASECMQWYIAEKVGSNSRDLQEARKRLADAQERKVSLELAQMRGDLMDTDDVMQSHMLMATTFSSQLRSLGQRVAGILQNKSPSEIRQIVDDECRIILEATCHCVGIDPGEASGGGDPDASAPANGRRVGRPKSDTTARKPGAGPLAIQ